jgi:transposase
MLPKIPEKNEAIRLRLLGHSLNDIATQLGISKSSASIWLRYVKLSNRAKHMISQKSHAARLKAAETHRAQTRAYLEQSASLATTAVANARLDKNYSGSFVPSYIGAKVRRQKTTIP